MHCVITRNNQSTCASEVCAVQGLSLRAGSEPPQTAATTSADLAVLNKHPASKANSPNEVTTSEPLRKDTGASHVIPPTAATAAAARQPVLQHPPQSSLPDSVKPKSQSIAHAAAAQNAAQKHVVGEELDAKAVTDVADQQGQGGTGGVDKPQRPAALRIGLDDKPAEDHVVGEEQDLRLSTATEHHHGQKRTRDVQQSVGGSVHMLSGGEIGNNAARADRQVTSSVPGQQRDANANTSCEANARQEGHEPGDLRCFTRLPADLLWYTSLFQAGTFHVSRRCQNITNFFNESTSIDYY